MAHSPSNPAPTKKRRKKKRVGLWYTFFLLFVAIGTLGASTAVGLIIGYVNRLPPIEELENYDPPEVSYVYDRTGLEVIGQFSSDERRQVATVEEIPLRLKQAVLAIEDDRFYDHFGVDLKAVLRAFRANYESGTRSQGASTITMQLPRNIIKDEVGREKLWERKIKEVFLTFQIERRYSKDQILAFYLNHVDFGHRSAGVKTAAETYFSKTLDQLTIAECATLAAILKGTTIYNPISNPERSKKRRDLVIDRMYDLGWITKEAHDEAKAEPLVVRRNRARTNVANSVHPYFADALKRDLNSPTYQVRTAELQTKGLTIRSTLDTTIQKIAEEELKAGLIEVERKWQEKKAARYYEEAEELGWPPKAGQSRLMKITAVNDASINVEYSGFTGEIALPEKLFYYEPERVIKTGERIDVKITSIDNNRMRVEGELADTRTIQGAVIVLDVKTGDVLASVGGYDFLDEDNAGNYNRAVMGGRPAGSTVKPFFYAAAMKRGFGPHDVIYDEPVTYRYGNQEYKPRNYEKAFFQNTTLIEGIEHSRNVVTVRLFEAVGVKRAISAVSAFDLGLGNAPWSKKVRPELSACLGPQDMSPLEIAAAYLVFANQGIARRPQFFREVTENDGRPFIRHQTREAIVMSPIEALQMVYALRMAVVHGTGQAEIGSKFPSPPYPPIAGKTGTTNNNTDAWFVGFSPDLLIVSYVGHDTLRTLGPQMTGGRVAGPIWANIFKRVYETRDDWRMSFEQPSGIETVSICGETGKRISEVCGRWSHSPYYYNVPYKRGTAPKSQCDGVPSRYIIAPIRDTGGWVVSPDELGSEAPNNRDPTFGFTN